MAENALLKIHSEVLAGWHLAGIDETTQCFNLGLAADILTSYRQGEWGKDEALTLITTCVDGVFINEEQAKRDLEKQQLKEQISLEPIPFQGTAAYGAYDTTLPIATHMTSGAMDLITAAYDFEIGVAFSFQDLLTGEGIRPALARFMDDPSFDLTDALYGLHQKSTDEWFSKEAKIAVLREGAFAAIGKMRAMIIEKRLVQPPTIDLFFAGFGAVDTDWTRAQVAKLREEMNTGNAIPVRRLYTWGLGKVAGIKYGGTRNSVEKFQPSSPAESFSG